ncbi:MAG: D-aminoacylase [Nitrospirales bacterium]|nr:D-aminoacylase [Nitrospirales bacterium]
MLDYLITGGTVIDGTGGPPVELDLGVQGERIVFVGKGAPEAREVVDAGGLMVCPGFIDTHSHSEFTNIADGRAEGRISQGVTTEINGNCGLSAAPLYGEARERREPELQELGIMERWSGLGEYFRIIEKKGIAVNVATLCGHGNIRASVIGYGNREAEPQDMARMQALLSEAVKEGALGLSTGLIYPPGIYSSTEELVELCKTLNTGGQRGGGIYASHMRSEGDSLIEAMEEAISIGRESGARVHISHVKTSGKQNWQKIDSAIALMERCREAGLQLTCDRYPYTAAATDLDIVLPSWTYEGGTEEELKRLKDPGTRKKIEAEIGLKDDDYWKGIALSSVTREENRWMEGETMLEISRRIGKRPMDALFEILIDERLRVGAVFFSMSEENLRRFLSLPYVMIGSDSSGRSFSGPTCIGKPHPRAFGTFPRFLGRFVKEGGIMDLPEAVRRITSLPARTFGLQGRGLIREGMFADITVFDCERVEDRATFQDPYRMSEGIVHVFVNGIPAMRHGKLTGSLRGKVIRNV